MFHAAKAYRVSRDLAEVPLTGAKRRALAQVQRLLKDGKLLHAPGH